jgi:thiopeptide-type bacteriocin biosynthesis protein
VRYRDSGYHIRLRLKIRDDAVGHVLSRMKTKLSESVRFHLIREYQADTYRREMERYGPDVIELVEEFFYGSSALVLNYLKAAEKRSFPYTYHSLAFVSVTFLIESFIADADERLMFLERMVALFYTEFATDKSLKIDLDQKFRELKVEVHSLSQNEDYYKSLKLTRCAELYAVKVTAVVRAASHFNRKRNTQLLADLIHMHLNRLFVDRQRNQELIIYYCLYKYRISAKAIEKKKG